MAEAFMKQNHEQPEQRAPGTKWDITDQWDSTHGNAWREPLVNGPARHPLPVTADKTDLPLDVARSLDLFDTTVNCPRCFADNRNWLQLAYKPTKPHKRLWARFLRFPLSMMVSGAAIFLAVLVLWLGMNFNLVQTVFLTITIVLTAWLTTKAMNGSGWAQREYAYRRPFMSKPNLWQRIPPILRAGLPILPLTLLVVPIFVFVLIPLSFDVLRWLLAASAAAPPSVDLDREFLRAWLFLVGGVWTIVYFSAFVETDGFVKHLVEVLPPPVFTSVAKMTPVAIRDAEHALRFQEGNGIIPQIQWMFVERLSDGGIKLIGLHREEFMGDEIPDKVRAHRYTIETDIWCRIVKTSIQDVTVPPSIQLQQFWREIMDINSLFARQVS